MLLFYGEMKKSEHDLNQQLGGFGFDFYWDTNSLDEKGEYAML